MRERSAGCWEVRGNAGPHALRGLMAYRSVTVHGDFAQAEQPRSALAVLKVLAAVLNVLAAVARPARTAGCALASACSARACRSEDRLPARDRRRSLVARPASCAQHGFAYDDCAARYGRTVCGAGARASDAR